MDAPRHRLSDDRLAHVVDGRVQEDAGVLLFSSKASPWAGFSLERHSLSPGCERRLLWPTPRLGLVTAGGLSLTEKQTSRSQRDFPAGPDSITIWPGGHESTSLSWSGSAEIIDVDMAPATLERLGESELARVELAIQPGIQDRHLASLLRAMEAEVSSGCPSGRLYGESISLAVAAHIVGRYSVGLPSPGARGGLACRRLVRILDFVHANLGSDLGVAELAALAHLSPSQFAQVFRRSMGMTPHQYVLRQRIAEARRLLTRGQMSVMEVALATGFASQSHFGETFRQMVGTTPRRYQQEG